MQKKYEILLLCIIACFVLIAYYFTINYIFDNVTISDNTINSKQEKMLYGTIENIDVGASASVIVNRNREYGKIQEVSTQHGLISKYYFYNGLEIPLEKYSVNFKFIHLVFMQIFIVIFIAIAIYFIVKD